jgi:hypothetical protein
VTNDLLVDRTSPFWVKNKKQQKSYWVHASHARFKATADCLTWRRIKGIYNFFGHRQPAFELQPAYTWSDAACASTLVLSSLIHSTHMHFIILSNLYFLFLFLYFFWLVIFFLETWKCWNRQFMPLPWLESKSNNAFVCFFLACFGGHDSCVN